VNLLAIMNLGGKGCGYVPMQATDFALGAMTIAIALVHAGGAVLLSRRSGWAACVAAAALTILATVGIALVAYHNFIADHESWLGPDDNDVAALQLRVIVAGLAAGGASWLAARIGRAGCAIAIVVAAAVIAWLAATPDLPPIPC
jgi:hypothetical protein